MHLQIRGQELSNLLVFMKSSGTHVFKGYLMCQQQFSQYLLALFEQLYNLIGVFFNGFNVAVFSYLLAKAKISNCSGFD